VHVCCAFIETEESRALIFCPDLEVLLLGTEREMVNAASKLWLSRDKESIEFLTHLAVLTRRDGFGERGTLLHLSFWGPTKV